MANTDKASLFKISYGLYVLSAKDGEKDNGCIINTPVQVTDTPCRITIAISKQNYTTELIEKTGRFNLSVLTEEVPFSLFQNFGFQSGREADKFNGLAFKRSENEIPYLTEYTNGFLSCQVVSSQDVGTHILFLAEVTEGKVLSDKESVTYSYYHKHIKPRPEQTKTKGYRCTICGYVYEGEPLPEDFICPLCKHGADVFEKIE